MLSGRLETPFFSVSAPAVTCLERPDMKQRPNFLFIMTDQQRASLHHPCIGLGIAHGSRSMIRSEKMKYREILVNIILFVTFHLNTSPVFAQTDPLKTVNVAIPVPPGGEVGGVIESVDVTGVVLTPLDTNSLEQAVGAFVAEGVEAIADCFLFFLQTQHMSVLLLNLSKPAIRT
jgi:hypothetical protein